MRGLANIRRTCSEFRQRAAVDRHSFLKVGMLGAGGLSLSELLRHEASAGRPPASTDKSVIILWMRGGPSHIDMWDTKPDAPVEFRGEFGTTSTNVPGIQLGDMLPMCAGVMDKWSIIRSLHHGNAGHSAGDQILFTGYPPGPNPNDNVMPSCGSIVAEQLGHLTPELPSYVMIPRMVPGTTIPTSLARRWRVDVFTVAALSGRRIAKVRSPRDNPKSPQDVLATIYDHLGVNMKKHYRTPSGRPVAVLPSGEQIHELF